MLTHLSNGSDAGRLRVRLGSEWVNVLIADIDASPWLSRRKHCENSLASRRTAAHHRAGRLQHAARVRAPGRISRAIPARDGRPHHGFRETWPFNLPLLSLDQIWLSRDFTPVFASRRTTFASDHSPSWQSFPRAASSGGGTLDFLAGSRDAMADVIYRAIDGASRSRGRSARAGTGRKQCECEEGVVNFMCPEFASRLANARFLKGIYNFSCDGRPRLGKSPGR